MTEITDFQLGQGENFQIYVQIYNQSSGSVPVDITNYQFSGQVRENYTTDELAATFSFEKVQPYVSGGVYIRLSSSDTSTFTQRRYVYDVLLTSGSTVRRIMEGAFAIRPAVTR